MASGVAMSRALCQCILFFGKHQKFRRFFCLLAESGELVGAAFAWIEWRFMDTPPLSAEAKLMLGGGLALAAGVLIGSAQEASLACGADCGPRRRPPEFVDNRQAEGIRPQTQKRMARMGRGVWSATTASRGWRSRDIPARLPNNLTY